MRVESRFANPPPGDGSKVTIIYGLRTEEYADYSEFFDTREQADEYVRCATGDLGVAEIDELITHSGKFPHVALYQVVVSEDGSWYHRHPTEHSPGHKVDVCALHFAGHLPVKSLHVHVEAESRAEAGENAVRVAKGAGFIQ